MLWGTKWETAKVALLLCNDVVFLSSANPVCTGIKNECMEKHFRKRIMLWGTRWEETAASLTLLESDVILYHLRTKCGNSRKRVIL